jgi:pullulanase/glycogen debranching enzyme
MEPADTTGRSFPIGATVGDGGVNFSLYSLNASSVASILSRNASFRALPNPTVLCGNNNAYCQDKEIRTTSFPGKKHHPSWGTSIWSGTIV